MNEASQSALPTDRHGENMAPDEAEELQALQDSQFLRLKRMAKLLPKTDSFDIAIHSLVDALLECPPAVDTAVFEDEDTRDFMHTLPSLVEVMSGDFFGRITFPFRILRRCLSIHFIDPVEDDFIRRLHLTSEEQDNERLFEQIWFLKLLGATDGQVQSALSSLRQNSTARAALKFHRPTELGDNSFSRMRSQSAPVRSDSNPAPALTSTQHRTIDNFDQTRPVETQPSNATFARIEEAQTLGRGALQLDERSQDPRRAHSLPVNHEISQSKKGQAVETYFKDRRFRGATEQSVNNLIRDFEICAAQQCLDERQMSLFFVNALGDPARQYFLTHCSLHMPFAQIAAHMRRHYNSDTRQFQLQSEMDSLDLMTLMRKQDISDDAKGLRKLVDHINALASQLPPGFVMIRIRRAIYAKR